MPVSILVVALVLVMSGLGGFGMGLSLMPTDMSRAWLIVGASLFSGGMVALAIGFGVQSLATALMRTDRQPEAARALEPAAPIAPALEAAPPPAAGGHAGVIAAGGALLGAGALAVHTFDRKTPDFDSSEINTAQTPPEPPDADTWLGLRPGHELGAPEPVSAPAPTDAFEQELFALSESEREAAPPVIMGEPEPLAAELRLSPPFAEPQEAEAPVLESAPDPYPAPVPHIELPTLPEPEDEPEGHAALPAMSPAVPGLIADEDLASLQAEAPPLAPLSTLEIVGAYDSGGVRFTMYSDGSVHAAGPNGEQRYASLEALRKRLDAGLPAV